MGREAVTALSACIWGISVAGTLNARQGFPFIPNLLTPSRTGKRFAIGRVNIVGSVDVFNVTNTNTVLNRVTTQNSATANQVVEIAGPRVIRIGGRFSF